MNAYLDKTLSLDEFKIAKSKLVDDSRD